MNRVGIQLKPDHPALAKQPKHFGLLSSARGVGSELIPTSGDERTQLCLAAFANAYGVHMILAQEFFKKGMIEMREEHDGSMWIEFVSELSLEDATAALRALGIMGIE